MNHKGLKRKEVEEEDDPSEGVNNIKPPKKRIII
jgi:hypothetical protein